MGSSRDSSLASLVVVISRRRKAALVGGIFPLQDARRVGNEKQFSSNSWDEATSFFLSFIAT